jgi:hypothetical protein
MGAAAHLHIGRTTYLKWICQARQGMTLRGNRGEAYADSVSSHVGGILDVKLLCYVSPMMIHSSYAYDGSSHLFLQGAIF